jgi:hypothetical protein
VTGWVQKIFGHEIGAGAAQDAEKRPLVRHLAGRTLPQWCGTSAAHPERVRALSRGPDDAEYEHHHLRGWPPATGEFGQVTALADVELLPSAPTITYRGSDTDMR